MTPLSRLILELIEDIPLDLGGEDEGVALLVNQLHVELPVETQLSSRPRFTAPRRRTKTGFDHPVAHITLGLVRDEG